MTALSKILHESLESDESIIVTVDCHIQKVLIRIHDSRTMYLHGIPRQDSMGFTLQVAIDIHTNKGKKVMSKLVGSGLLSEFALLERPRQLMYLKDFKQNVDQLENCIEEVLAGLSNYRTNDSVSFVIQGAGDVYVLR